MGGIALTGEDFQAALRHADLELDLEEADDWFERLQTQGLLDLSKIHAQVLGANSIEEEVDLLVQAMAGQIGERGIDAIIRSERERIQLDINTSPAPKSSTGAPRL